MDPTLLLFLIFSIAERVKEQNLHTDYCVLLGVNEGEETTIILYCEQAIPSNIVNNLTELKMHECIYLARYNQTINIYGYVFLSH